MFFIGETAFQHLVCPPSDSRRKRLDGHSHLSSSEKTSKTLFLEYYFGRIDHTFVFDKRISNSAEVAFFSSHDSSFDSEVSFFLGLYLSLNFVFKDITYGLILTNTISTSLSIKLCFDHIQRCGRKRSNSSGQGSTNIVFKAMVLIGNSKNVFEFLVCHDKKRTERNIH